MENFETDLERLFCEPKKNIKLSIIDRYSEQQLSLVKFINDYMKEDVKLFKHKYRSKRLVSKIELIEKIEFLYDEIIKCVKKYLDGDFNGSFNILMKHFIKIDDTAMNRYTYYPIKGDSTTDEASILYRTRANEAYTLYEQEDMFHIPFEKRGLVSNQRFSASGYPCLYLGQSIYGCWEATNRPNVDMFNIMAFKATKRIHFLNLGIPILDADQRKGTFTADWYSNLVLRLACSLETKSHNDHFKQEYIIPQLVLSCLIKKNKNLKNDVYYGIRYTSTIYRQSRDLFNNKRLLYNYVLPITKSKDNGLCEKLVDLFEVSQVISLTNERITKNLRVKKGKDSDFDFLYDHVVGYHSTEFGELEYLLKSKIETFNKIK